MTPEPTPLQTLDVSWRRVRRAASRAGLTAETMHRVVDRQWRDLLKAAFVAAHTPSQWETADLHRWRWRTHALHQIENYLQLQDHEEEA